jgi:hypothetical protein
MLLDFNLLCMSLSFLFRLAFPVSCLVKFHPAIRLLKVLLSLLLDDLLLDIVPLIRVYFPLNFIKIKTFLLNQVLQRRVYEPLKAEVKLNGHQDRRTQNQGHNYKMRRGKEGFH